MRILLIEDDISYINGLIPEMARRYVVDVAYNTPDGEYMSEISDYDGIIIDSSLKDSPINTMAIKNKLINKNAPLMLLYDNNDFSYVVQSLDKGADLCVPKNAAPKDICDGMHVLIRKTNKIKEETIEIGVLSLNIKTKSLRISGKEINLRRKEYDILEYLAVNKGCIVSKEDLLEHLWASGIYILSNTVEVHIKHIRDKIEKPYGLYFIRTVRGFGYKLVS